MHSVFVMLVIILEELIMMKMKHMMSFNTTIGQAA